MRVGTHEAMAGKCLPTAAMPPASGQHQAMRKNGDSLRITVEGAIADHPAVFKIDVQHRREAEVHAAGAQLRRQHPTGLVCQGLGTFGCSFQICPSSRIGGRRVKPSRKRCTRPPS